MTGRFTDHHAFMVRIHLQVIEQLTATIAEITGRIETAVEPFRPTLKLLTSIPGVSDRAAVVIVAETGADMSRFPTAAHLVSWAGVCPGHNQSAGRTKSTTPRPGNSYLKGTLGNAAMGAALTNGSFFQACYRRLAARSTALKALVAVELSILKAVWNMLTKRRSYQDLGGDYYTRPRPHQSDAPHRPTSQRPRPHRPIRPHRTTTMTYPPELPHRPRDPPTTHRNNRGYSELFSCQSDRASHDTQTPPATTWPHPPKSARNSKHSGRRSRLPLDKPQRHIS